MADKNIKVLSLTTNSYSNIVESGLLINAVNDIKISITDNVASIYSDNLRFVDPRIKDNLYNLVKRPYIDKSNFSTYYIGLISSVQDNIAYPESDNGEDDFKTNTEFHIRKKSDFNSTKIETNIDYVDNMVWTEKLRDIYKEIYNSKHSVDESNIISIVPHNTLASKLDQLSALANDIDEQHDKYCRISDYLYDTDFIKGIGSHKYVKLEKPMQVLESISYIVNKNDISKLYLIKSVSKPKIVANMRGIDVPYVTVKLSNNIYICKIPEYLLKEYNDNILAIRYLAVTGISGGGTDIKRIDSDIPQYHESNLIYGKNIETPCNIIKQKV